MTPTESPQSSEDRTQEGPAVKRSSSMQANSGSPSNQGSKSFKEVLAERNKQAQRRFRQRQKVCRPSESMAQCIPLPVRMPAC